MHHRRCGSEWTWEGLSRTVVHLGPQLDDARLAAEFGLISGQTMDVIPYEQTASVEVYADARFRGQSHELTVRIQRPTREHIAERFIDAYRQRYGQVPLDRDVEIVTLRVRRVGRRPDLRLPPIPADSDGAREQAELILNDGAPVRAPVLTRCALVAGRPMDGPFLLIDPEATAFIPPGWQARANADGAVILQRAGLG